MKCYLTLIVILICNACSQYTDQNPENGELTNIVHQEDREMISDDSDVTITNQLFRSDGFRAGISSEWIEAEINSELNYILNIEYWNTNDEKPLQFEIISQEYFNDEIAGYSGTLKIPGDDSIFEFGLIEERFNLLYNDGLFQEFYFEWVD